MGTVCLLLFAIIEHKVKSPMIDLTLFHRYLLMSSNVTAFLAYYVLFTALFLLPFYFEDVLNYPTALSGLLLMPVPASMAALAPYAGRACDRFGAHTLKIAGSALLMVGSGLLVLISSHRDPLLLVIAEAILGSGLGLFTPANNRATMAATPRDKLGVVGGLLNMMRSLGLIFGIDISGMLFMSVAGAASPETAAAHGTSAAIAFLPASAFMEGFHVVLLTLVGIALLSTMLSFPRSSDGDRARKMQGLHEPVELM
jgi:MFS family permease